VIVPFEEAALNWAQEHKINYTSYNELLQNEEFIALIQSEVDRLMEGFATFERVKKFCLIAESFSQDGGELTPSLKVKRNVVEQKYAAQIEQFYEVE
jgi:long-chain acyl-CoA synthetase